MKKEAVRTPKKDAKTVTESKCSISKSVNSKQAKTIATVADMPETIELSAEQQPVPQSADADTVTPSLESAIIQNGTELAEVISAADSIDSSKITEQSPVPQPVDTIIVTIPKESKVLRERLGLTGYITETVKLPSTLEILGCKAEGVVFAKQIVGADRVLLHVSLVDAAGKRSIVSSRKKVPQPKWQAISESLTALSIFWRDKELKRTAK